MEPVVLETLRKYGLTPVLFNVLSCIAMRDGSVERNKLATSTLGLVDIYGEHSPAAYEEAIELALNTDLIKVLTPEDCKKDKERWQHDFEQFCGEIEYVAGNVDFTPVGGQLFARIETETKTQQGERPYASITGYSWRLPGQVKIFTASEDSMQESLLSIRNGQDVLSYSKQGEIQILKIDGPVEIGSWWINRFVRLPVGYRACIHYTQVSPT